MDTFIDFDNLTDTQRAAWLSLANLAERAVQYLEHPDVAAMPFAVRSEVTAVNIRIALHLVKWAVR